ncbi:MAG: TIM barrel protein [Planctomycetota bacterium]
MSVVKLGVRVDAIPQNRSTSAGLRRSLELVASMGAQSVELCGRTLVPISNLSDTGVRALRKMMDDLNLWVAAIRFQTRHGYDHLPDLDRRVEATKAAMKAAYQLGAPIVINQIGRVPQAPCSKPESAGLTQGGPLPTSVLQDLAAGHADESLTKFLSAAGNAASTHQSDPETTRWNTMQSVLEDLGRYGAKTGTVLAAETGTEPGGDLADLLRASDEAFVCAVLNPGQLILNRHSVVDAVDALGDRIAMVSAVDCVLDLAAGRGLTVPLGQGIADFPNLIGHLEDIPFRGDFVIGRDQMNPETALEELRKSASYLTSEF